MRLLIVVVLALVFGSAQAASTSHGPRKGPTSFHSAKVVKAKAVARKTRGAARGVGRVRAKLKRPPRPSEGQLAGLHRIDDPLDLRSSVALVVDQDTDEVLFEKNPRAVLPIASITKLMTALITVEAGLDPDETLEIEPADHTADRVRSRLLAGVTLSRAQALHVALMSSENHAAQLLGRTYPGGVRAAVAAMNAKAQLLGMHDTRFADPTGLSVDNRSSPGDLVRLVKAAYEHLQIREYSTSSELTLPVGDRVIRYGNTNRLTTRPDWEIGLQKTGYISAAGRCMVMQAAIEGKRVVMVLLDSVGRYSRIGDAQRIRDWLQARRPRPQQTASVTGAAQPF